MTKLLSVISLCFLLLNAEAITTADITAETSKAMASCLHYRVLGTCYWQYLQVTNTTLYIEHYLPDVVVTVFDQPKNNAWVEMRDSLDPTVQAAEANIVKSITGDEVGYGRHSATNLTEQQVFFKEAEVIGNPALSAIDQEQLLPSTTTPLMPYYQSMLDAAMWRGFPPLATPEQIVALAQDFTRRIGVFPSIWGGAFPIEGKVNASDEVKASAVIAQRAVNLLSTTVPLHVYQGVSNVCGEACDASDFHENDENTQFQRIYPEPETSCSVLGKSLNYGDSSLMAKAQGAYVWVVWRHYQGCIQGVGQYIGRTG
jgi:integrating conjugative element protein (TIGR03756 family)